MVLTPLLDRCPIARGRCNFVQKYRIDLFAFGWILSKAILDLGENRITFQAAGNHFPANERQLILIAWKIYGLFLFRAVRRGHWHCKYDLSFHFLFSLHPLTYVFNYLLAAGD